MGRRCLLTKQHSRGRAYLFSQLNTPAFISNLACGPGVCLNKQFIWARQGYSIFLAAVYLALLL